MLFNSYSFVFLFLPLLLVLAWLIQRAGRQTWLVHLLLLASMAFYAWWSLPYLLLLVGSIVVNFTLSRRLQEIREGGSGWLWIGIAFNLGLLGYFKYANFFIDQLNQGIGLSLDNPPVLLPLAISFFTFQQIAFLVDCRRGEAVRGGFLQYALFVSFFPQLIAGPIVRSAEVMPQLLNIGSRLKDWQDHLAPGMTLFVLGLSKKVILADQFAQYASPVFAAADAGVMVTGAEAWAGALCYTFQLYFDFSGYSDMAIGLAWMFGIRLPINFLSPYRARSIADFWRRWHITLSRFLREYLYIPLGGNRRGPTRQRVNLMLTMLLGGLWHGAGWTFVLWGGVHGLFLIINHVWRSLRVSLGLAPSATSHPGRALAWLLTFLAVVFAWVLFRAETLDGAILLLSAMVGWEGFSIPRDYVDLAPPLGALTALPGIHAGGDQVLWAQSKLGLAGLIATGFILVLLVPNTARIFALVETTDAARRGPLRWQPGVVWVGVTVALLITCLVCMTQVSEFLYYQF